MKHEIDLKSYEIRTDLIDYYINDTNINVKEYDEFNVNVKRFYIDKEYESLINKKKGNYTTISYDDITDQTNFLNVSNILIKELKNILEINKIKKNDSCLIIGLGNIESTPDALGPKTIKEILVTNPLYELNQLEEGFMRTYAISPNVYANTGIETTDYIKSIIKEINVDFLIVIDSLASESIDRINKTIQITDTGIHPGSGIGNKRKEISYETTGIKTIAIGIPTVVDATTIIVDTIGYLYKNYATNKKSMHNPKSRLILYKDIKYNEEIKESDKKKLFGIIGTLNDTEIRQLINEVLTPVGLNMMVTPKEVDFMISKESQLLSNAINKVLHKKYR